jgi:hypothetical protein
MDGAGARNAQFSQCLGYQIEGFCRMRKKPSQGFSVSGSNRLAWLPGALWCSLVLPGAPLVRVDWLHFFLGGEGGLGRTDFMDFMDFMDFLDFLVDLMTLLGRIAGLKGDGG